VAKFLCNTINSPVVHIRNKNWKNPLSILDRMCNLLVAHRRSNGIWADQEQESIRFFNTTIDLLLPVFAFGDALPVNPGIQSALSQRLNDLLPARSIS